MPTIPTNSPFLLLLLTVLLAAISSAQSIPTTLNITTLAARNNVSTLECWALEPGFVKSTEPGTAGSAAISIGQLGGNASYSVLPGGFDGGRHNAPVGQWVVFLSGLAHITLPHSTDEAWVIGGKHGVILALDTAHVSGDGHITAYPSEEATITLEVPLAGGVLPKHRVLHTGACRQAEQVL